MTRAATSGRGKPFRTKTLRLRVEEHRAIEGARGALNGLERTQLVQEAVLMEAARLGVAWGTEGSARARDAWPFLPDRKRSGGVRVSITLSLPVAEIVTRAARSVGASEPMFIVGATLAHVGCLKRAFCGTHAASPEHARAIRAGLARVELPERYERLSRQR